MADTSGVLNRLLSSLSTSDPTWDTSVGSATYKIMEAVAQEIAAANNNSVLQTYSYDISTKSGAELDVFCNLFGISRQLGKRASGTVTFSSISDATNIYDIPIGTQVAVPVGQNNASPIYFATTAPAVLLQGETSIEVPVTAVLAGTRSNVPSDTVTTLVNTIVGITSVNNDYDITGGTDPETDTSLRARWQNNVFSNVTGTSSKYIYTALQNSNVTRANAISAQNFYQEQLQINAQVSGNNRSTFTTISFALMAYSGTPNIATNGTYSGTTTVAAASYTYSTTGTVLAAGLQALVSGVAPSLGIVVSATPTGNTISGGLTINFSNPSPYRLTITGTGSVVSGGVTSVGGADYREYIRSNNPDLGISGTLSYNGTLSGYLFPQGNELMGIGLNTSTQTVYTNNTDYVYPSGTNISAPLNVNILNSLNRTELFIGNTTQFISEYTPASSRAVMPTSGNYADIFIDSTTATSVDEQLSFNTSVVISGGAPIPYLNTANYVLASGIVASGNTTTSGDYYIELGVQPVLNFPSQLSITSSGIADTIYIYNNATNSGITYPIATNPNGFIAITGTCTSGSQQIAVPRANTFLYPGLAIGSGTYIAPHTYIEQVSSNAIYINNLTLGSGNVTTSGKTIVYPIYDTTDQAGSTLQYTGLAVESGELPASWTLPTGQNWATYTHDYNADVTSVETLINQSRPMGVNTLVRQADLIPLNINMTIVYSNGSVHSTVNSSVQAAINAYLTQIPYLGVISFNGIASKALATFGVTSARVDSIQVMSNDLVTQFNGYVFTSDFLLASNQLPVLNNINYTIKGASNF